MASWSALWLAGCAGPPPEGDDTDAATPTAGTADTAPSLPTTLELPLAPIPLGNPPSEHHASVGLRPDGVAVVAWYGELDLGAARVDVHSGETEPLSLADFRGFTHPRVRAGAGGFLVVASAVGVDGLAGRRVLADGRTLEDPVTLVETPAL